MRKINFGIILIVLAIILIVLYSINEYNTMESDKITSLEFIKKYFNVYNKYSVLEKEDRNIDKDMDMDKFNLYISNMNDELSNYILDSSQDTILEQYKNRLDDQIKGKYMFHEYNKEIIEVSKYTFDKNYIYILLKIKITVNKEKRLYPTFNQITNRYTGEIAEQIGEEYGNEILYLKKMSSNNYKVAYHSIMDYEIYSFESDTPQEGGLTLI